MLSDDDKQRIIEALEESVENNPDADKPIPNMTTQDGQPVTHRKLVEMTIQNPRFFEMIEKAVETGQVTVDQIVDSIKKGPQAQPAVQPAVQPRPPKMGL